MKREASEVGKIVVHESLRAYVLKMYYNTQLAAHQGKKRTMKQITTSFYWPGMKADVTKWVKAGLACTRRKTPRPMRAGIKGFSITQWLSISWDRFFNESKGICGYSQSLTNSQDGQSQSRSQTQEAKQLQTPFSNTGSAKKVLRAKWS